MFFRNRKMIADVRRILGWVGGGVHKRIDENRELLELLRDKAPEFIEQNSWVVHWLQSQDDFLCELASAVPITEGQFLSQTRDPARAFPRPWPGETAESINRLHVGTATENTRTSTLPTPTEFGLTDDVTFDVVRAGSVGTKPATWAEMLDFLDACGIDVNSTYGEISLSAVVAGVPFEIDGANMAFKVRGSDAVHKA
jgi:hypothetical protein